MCVTFLSCSKSFILLAKMQNIVIEEEEDEEEEVTQSCATAVSLD